MSAFLIDEMQPTVIPIHTYLPSGKMGILSEIA